ncbi:hypothetical protein FACS189450_05750 [Spirochaetia bacterium]|nr:hypothetical protein FACS189450_05750 [Spirochaetia bacterium]
MQKFVCIMAVLIALNMQVTAQEQEQQAAPQMPAPSTVKLFMGDLTIHGKIQTGFQAAMNEQEGLAQDGNWSLGALDAGWRENRAEIVFDYRLQNFGAFVDFQARAWSPNTFGDAIKPRYAFVWLSGLNDKIKFSMGKLYDEILVMQNKVWKTDGFGERIRFTDEDKFSARIEVKPIPGLNVGAQFFFVDTVLDPVNSRLAERGLGETGALRELGIGASYSNRQFDISGGLRLDSAVDIMSRDDSKTYLPAYYGDANMLGTAGAPFLGPKYKYKAEVIAPVSYPGAGSGDFTPVLGETPFYENGHYIFAGFQWKRTKAREIVGDVHGGIYNLGAFDKFGYGRFAERVTWYQLLPKFDLGLIMQQEFYGSDVFPDDMTNSPFLQFAPHLAYNLIYLPGTNGTLPLLQAYLTPFIGVCPDVLDIYVDVKAGVTMMMGIFSAELFYDIAFTDFVDAIEKDKPGSPGTPGIKPETRHTIGLALSLMF